MKQRRRLFSSMLALVIVLTMVLAGCSQNGNSGSNAKESGTSNTPSDNTQNNANAPAAEPEKPVLEPVELSIYYPGTEQKDTVAVEEELNNQLKDKINATIKIHAIDWGSWAQKINLMVSSGEPFDLMFTAGWDNFSGNVAKGAFLELNDLIDQYAPETKKQINPFYLTGTAVKGKNYAIPVEKELASQFGIVLNKSMVDKYKFDLTTIKTFADLEPMLQTINENEPDVTPFWANRNVVGDLPIEAVGNNQVPGAIMIGDTNAKIINQFETPEMKDLLNLMRSWNQKGFFQEDPATKKDAAAANKAGKVFAQWQQLKPGKAAE
ncbi:extracellular solute-binding protein, partial [Paenibacillus sepulcri]|nr:extracellular solute-binding protein [Paenibacillus sepulcri]